MKEEIVIKEDWKGVAIVEIVNKLSRGYKDDITLCKELVDMILQTPTKIELNDTKSTK